MRLPPVPIERVPVLLVNVEFPFTRMSSTTDEDFEGSPSAACPFCGAVSWVGSVDGACEHVFATGDSFEGTEAWSQIDEALEEHDRTVVEDFLERSTREQDAVIGKLGVEAAKTLSALRDSPLWWRDFIENEMVTADIDEPLASFDDNTPSDVAKKFMTERSYDVVGVRCDGAIRGYARLEDLETGVVGEHVRGLSERDTLRETDPLLMVIERMREKRWISAASNFACRTEDPGY